MVLVNGASVRCCGRQGLELCAASALSATGVMSSKKGGAVCPAVSTAGKGHDWRTQS